MLQAAGGEPPERRPVFLVLPSEATRLQQGPGQYIIAFAATVVSIVTTLGFALSTYVLADGGLLLDQLEKGDTSPLDTASPIAFGIGGIFLAHEFAHALAARKHDLWHPEARSPATRKRGNGDRR